MYTGKHAHLRPLQPAFIMASTGEAVTYREFEARSNRLAHLFRDRGLRRLDHYAIFMENNSRYLQACGASASISARRSKPWRSRCPESSPARNWPTS
jgi:long-chain acyl-CoA synthetase